MKELKMKKKKRFDISATFPWMGCHLNRPKLFHILKVTKIASFFNIPMLIFLNNDVAYTNTWQQNFIAWKNLM